MHARLTHNPVLRSDRRRAFAWLGLFTLLLSLLAPQLSIASADAAQVLTSRQETCEEGFVLNERTGECEREPLRVQGQIVTECPEGTERERETGACIPIPATETPEVTEEVTEVPETETPTEVATEPPAPMGYAQAIKRACPEGFVPDETTTITDLQNTCLDPIEGVLFHLLVGDVAHASVPTDATGLSQLGSAPVGEVTLVEEIPAGYGEPIVYCAEGYAFGPFEHAYTEEDRQPVLGGNAIAWTLPADTLLQCFFYNIVGDGGAPGDLTTQDQAEGGEGAEVTVIKHRCPLGVPEDSTVDQYIVICTALFEDIDFTLDHAGGSFPGTTDEAGQVTWPGIPAGSIEIQEEIPDGYKAPLAFCNWFEGENVLLSGQVDATGGLIELDVPDDATAVVCHVFNIADPEQATSLTVNKWRCPPSFDELVDDPEVQCVTPMDGVTFTLDGFEATTGEAVPGQAVFLDIPAGDYVLAEDAPETVDHAFIGGCSVNGEDVGLIVIAGEIPSLPLQVEAGDHWVCDWYNVPKPDNRVIVHKRLCDPGLDLIAEEDIHAEIQDIVDSCPTDGDGIEFTLDNAEGSSTQAIAGGATWWDGVPVGPFTLTEHIPAGYGEPIVYCQTNTADENGDLVLGDWALVPAPGGVVSGSMDAEYYDVFSCWFLNVPGETGNLTVMKWTCPPGYDVHAEGVDPAADCTEAANGVEFQFGQPGLGEEATLQETGNLIDGGVRFTSLAPGTWKLVELAPDGITGAFIGSCTVNGAPVPAAVPLNEGFEWEVDIEAAQTILCHWYNVPDDGGSITIEKYLCPAAYDFDAPMSDPVADCTDPHDGVTFNLDDGNAPDPDQSRQTGDDGPGTVIFPDLEPGTWTVTEEVPAGIVDARAFCPTITDNPQVFNDPPRAVFEVAEGEQYSCLWFNVPEEVEENAIDIHKWQCPEGAEPDQPVEWYEANCVQQHDGVEFTVASDIGIAVQETAGGTASFPGLPAGTVSIQETIPDGFGAPMVFCGVEGDPQPYPAPTGHWQHDFPNDGLTETLVCWVFNIPGDAPSVTITKWTCPPGYDLFAAGADPKVDCTEATNGIDFQFGPSGGGMAELQTTGDVIDGGVVFDELEPGVYKAVEVVPEGIASVFVLECTGHLMGVLQPYPLQIGNVLDNIDLDAGEHLTCDWYNVPEIEGGTLTVIKSICATETFVSEVDCEVYEHGATFDLRYWTGTWDLVATETTDGSGRIQWTDLPDGEYWFEEHDGAWCHIASDALYEDGPWVIVLDNEETVVHIYNCDPGWVPDDTPEKYPNTGVPPEAAKAQASKRNAT